MITTRKRFVLVLHLSFSIKLEGEGAYMKNPKIGTKLKIILGVTSALTWLTESCDGAIHGRWKLLLSYNETSISVGY